MGLLLVKLLSALLLFVVALVGGALPLRLAGVSKELVSVGNAFAGGVLVSVALVHMLADGWDELGSAGRALSLRLGGDGEYPLGAALLVLGFLLVVGVELAADGHGHGHAAPETPAAREPLDISAPRASPRFAFNVEQAPPPPALPAPEVGQRAVAGFAAVVAISFHSVIEGFAAGATEDEEQTFAITLAIACHKGFAAFGVGSVLLPLRSRRGWLVGISCFALTTPLAMVAGAFAENELKGATVAAITCVAAGSLLAIGINEMMMPAFATGTMRLPKFFAACCSAVGMSLLAVWI